MSAFTVGSKGRWLLICGDGADAAAFADGLGDWAVRQYTKNFFDYLTFPDGEILRLNHAARTTSAEHVAHKAARRDIRGVLVLLQPCLVAAKPEVEAAAIVRALSLMRPGLAVAVLLVDVSLADNAVMGGSGAHPEAVIGSLLEAASRTALDAAANDGLEPASRPALLLPAALASREPAWRATIDAVLGGAAAARFVSLNVIGCKASPDAWLRVLPPLFQQREATRPHAPRPLWPIFSGVAAVLALAGVAFATSSDVNDLERELTRHGHVMLRGTRSAQVSPSALASLGALVRMTDRGELRLPLLPASWGDSMERMVTGSIEDNIRSLLVLPVQRHLLRQETLVAESIALFANSGIGTSESEGERAAAQARLVVELDRPVRQFRLEADGSPRAQWEALAGWSAGEPVSLDWLDTTTGVAAFAAATAQIEAQPARPMDLANRLLSVLEDRRARIADDERLLDFVASADRAMATLLRKTDERDVSAAVEQAKSAIDAIVREREPGMAEAGIDAYNALHEAGLIPHLQWQQAMSVRDQARKDRQQQLLSLHLEGIGPLFEGTPDPLGAILPSRQILTLRDALTDVAQSGFARMPALPPPDLAELVAMDGPPQAQPIAAAAQRLRALQEWLEQHGNKLPPALNQLVAEVASQTAAAAMRELASAYRRPSAARADFGAAVADDIDAVLDGLAVTDGGRLADAAWLVGVRSYRQLEAIDADYEKRNGFRLAGLIGGWNAKDAVLRAPGWRTKQGRRQQFEQGLRRLAEASQPARGLIKVLAIPAVAASLGSPRLVQKWQVLAAAAAEPEGDAGYQALQAYVGEVLPGFQRADCEDPRRFPATAGLPDGPFTDELRAIGEALTARCDVLETGRPADAG